MYNVNLCYPYRNEHVWLWVSDDTLGEPQINQECSCGGFLWQGRGLTPRAADGFDRVLEEAAIVDFLAFEGGE